jgi:hypothetical protein
MRMKIRIWHLAVFGAVTAVGGLLTLRFHVVPYEPAVRAGFPDANTVVSNGPWPILAIVAGIAAVITALGLAIVRKKKSS